MIMICYILKKITNIISDIISENNLLKENDEFVIVNKIYDIFLTKNPEINEKVEEEAIKIFILKAMVNFDEKNKKWN